MIPETRFDDVYRSIGTGVLADKAVIALARFHKSGRLGESEKRALELAKEFLRQAAEGPAVLEKKPLSRRSLERALALDEATEALFLEFPHAGQDHPERIITFLEKLLSTLDSITAGHKPPNDDLRNLRAFFASLGRFTMGKVATTIIPDVRQERSLW